MKVYQIVLSLLALGVGLHAADPDPNEFPSSAVSPAPRLGHVWAMALVADCECVLASDFVSAAAVSRGVEHNDIPLRREGPADCPSGLRRQEWYNQGRIQ